MANNILQYGHVYAWSREHGRHTVSMRFSYKYRGFAICRSKGHNFFRYLLGKIGASTGLMDVVSWDNPNPTESERRDRERRMLTGRNVVVEGWFVQYPELFMKYLDEIRALFRIDDETQCRVDKFLAERVGLRAGDCLVGLHVRRGDYNRWHGGRYFYDAATYGRLAARLIEEGRIYAAESGGRVRLVVCSNDATIDRSAFPDGTVFSDMGAVEDLALLSRCKLIAGPPSTFSLVAGMYGSARLCRVTDVEESCRRMRFDTFENLFTDII